MAVLLSGMMEHIFERYDTEDLLVYNGPWVIAITELTVGYGDFIPVTNEGRVLAVGPGLAGLCTLALVVSCALRYLELTHDEKKMTDHLYHKQKQRSQLADLTATFIQRWWRLHLARKHRRVQIFQQIRLFASISRIFKAKSAGIRATSSPELQTQIKQFRKNTKKIFRQTVQKLKGIRCSNAAAGAFSTHKFDMISRLLSCKRAYIRLTNLTLKRPIARAYTSLRRRSVLASSTIVSKRHSDMAIRRLRERHATIRASVSPPPSLSVIVDEQSVSRSDSDQLGSEANKTEN